MWTTRWPSELAGGEKRLLSSLQHWQYSAHTLDLFPACCTPAPEVHSFQQPAPAIVGFSGCQSPRAHVQGELESPGN